MTDFDGAVIARDVGELYDPLADQKGLALEIDPAGTAGPRNRELLGQALANLIDNAIKYAPPHGAEAAGAPADILVQAGSDGDFVRLSVSDRGPGIAEGDRERAVQRFVRLEQSRSRAGFGAGAEPCVRGGASAWRRASVRG